MGPIVNARAKQSARDGSARRKRVLPIAAVVLALVATACSSSSPAPEADASAQERGSSASPADVSPSNSDGGDQEGEASIFLEGLVADNEGGEPVEGGTLTFAIHQETTSLDPVDGNGLNGAFGGSELAAIYDVLLRYDSVTGEYEPQLADSLAASEDLTTWTLTLREGVSFTDGTPLDSTAVKASIDRHVAEEGLHHALIASRVQSIETPDPLTVVFTLDRGWAGFPFLLAEAPGAIVSPTAVEEFGEDLDSNPVGAGPFVLENFAAGEEISMTANPDYWGGEPHLDGLRFVPIGDGRARIDSLENGQIDAAFLDDPINIHEVRELGYGGYMTIFAMGGIVSINHTETHPGADINVRRAINYAVDPDVINQRAYDGIGLPGKEMYQEGSPWHTAASPEPYDLESAEQALATAQENGFDGTMRMLYLASREDEALTVEAMLEAAGFEITPVKSPSVNEFIQSYFVDRDWDITISGLGAEPTISPYVGLTAFLVEEGNYIDYQNEDMNALLEDLAAAAGQDEVATVMEDIQELWYEDIPVVVTYAQPKYAPWVQDLHGVVPTVQGTVLFHDAWLDR